MQDNFTDEALVDQAWAQLQQQLDQVMPLQRKRRQLVAWWWLPVLVGIGLARRLPEQPAQAVPPLAELPTAPKQVTSRKEAASPLTAPGHPTSPLLNTDTLIERPETAAPASPVRIVHRLATAAPVEPPATPVANLPTKTWSLPLVAEAGPRRDPAVPPTVCLPARHPALLAAALPLADLTLLPPPQPRPWWLGAEAGGTYGSSRPGWWLGLVVGKTLRRQEWSLALTLAHNQFSIAPADPEETFGLASQPQPPAMEGAPLELQTRQLAATLHHWQGLGARLRLGIGVGLNVQLQSRLLPSSVDQLKATDQGPSANRQLAAEALFGAGNSPGATLPPERLRQWNGHLDFGGQYRLHPRWAATIHYEQNLGNLLRSATYRVVPQQLRLGLQYRWSIGAAKPN